MSLTRRIAAISRWREQYNPLRGLTLRTALDLVATYTRGWHADLQWTYFFIEQADPDLFALVDRRSSRLLEMNYTVKSAKDAAEGAAKEQAAYITDKLAKIDNLYAAIEHLALASFRGFAHCEKWYDDAGDLIHLEVVDQWNVVRDGLRGGWKYNPRAFQTSYGALSESLVIDPADFVIRDAGRHIDRIGLLKFISSSLSEKDWDAFIEIYGIPSGVVTGPPNVPTDKAGEFSAAAEEIAKGGSGFLPYGSTYTKNDMPRGGAPFKERADYLTEKLILVGTGGMLTMLSRSGSGTLAGGAHADVFEQLAKAEARKISEVINRQLVDGWLAEGFPGQPKAVYFELAAEEETKLGEIVDHIQKLASAGFQVDPKDVSERTGYNVTARPAPAVAAPGNGGVDGPGADPATGDPAAIANRAHPQVDSGAAVFRRNAVRKLTAGQTEAVQPVLDRIAALKELPDDKFAAGLQQLRQDLPRLFAEARLHSPDIAAVWEQVLGTALVDGLADLPSASQTA